MTPNLLRQIERVVYLALGQAVSERARLIQEACLGDDDLRFEVESLVIAHEKEDGFLTAAPFRLMTELFKREGPEDVDQACNTGGTNGGGAPPPQHTLAPGARGGGGGFLRPLPEVGRERES